MLSAAPAPPAALAELEEEKLLLLLPFALMDSSWKDEPEAMPIRDCSEK